MGFPPVVLALIYVFVGLSVPAKYAQTKELVLATSRCIHDAVYMLLASLLFITHTLNTLLLLVRQHYLTHQRKRRLRRGNLVTLSPPNAAAASNKKRRLPGQQLSFSGVASAFFLLVFVVLPYVCWEVAVVRRPDVMAAMKGTIVARSVDSSLTGHPAMDFCEGEGGCLSARKLRHAWVLPQLLPRRFFNFYMGDESCRAESVKKGKVEVPLAHVNAARNVLMVPVMCPCGSLEKPEKGMQPRVFLERPWLSEMQPNGNEDASGDARRGGHTRLPGEQLQRELKRKYGEDGSKDDDTVLIRRDASGVILEVELRLSRFSPQNCSKHPSTESLEEKAVVAQWGLAGLMYYEIPLGRSPTVTVRCDCLHREVLFLHPVSLERETKEPQPARNLLPLPHPPRNVLVLMLDAVSRPEVLRSLPRFVSWVREFQRQAREKGFMVVESRGYTTFGFSTAGNFAPSVTGTSAFIEGADREAFPNISFGEKTLFSLAKKKYRSAIQTSIAMGYCGNVLHEVFGDASNSTGNGDSASPGVDRYLYGPMCRKEYSAQESNFRGPYSIRQRCLGSRHAHEVLLGYTKSLLTRHKVREERFFDFSYFIEGHEGTHSVLSQVDEALTSFLRDLQDTGFFSDPENVLVMYSDHGSHMGPYYLSSEAGRMERAMPFLLFFMHPSVFTSVDAAKRRSAGESERYFLQRANRLTTPMDLFLTLADLLEVGEWAKVSSSFATAPWPPRSMFDLSAQNSTAGKPTMRRPVSSHDVVNTSMRCLERFPLATHWCDF